MYFKKTYFIIIDKNCTSLDDLHKNCNMPNWNMIRNNP